MGGVDNEGFDGIDTMGRKFVKKGNTKIQKGKMESKNKK